MKFDSQSARKAVPALAGFGASLLLACTPIAALAHRVLPSSPATHVTLTAPRTAFPSSPSRTPRPPSQEESETQNKAKQEIKNSTNSGAAANAGSSAATGGQGGQGGEGGHGGYGGDPSLLRLSGPLL